MVISLSQSVFGEACRGGGLWEFLKPGGTDFFVRFVSLFKPRVPQP